MQTSQSDTTHAERVLSHGFVAIDGINIFYREAGPQGAPVVLLPHGYPCSSFEFRNFMLALADRWRLVAPDFPGFGYSDTPETFSYDFDGYADVNYEVGIKPLIKKAMGVQTFREDRGDETEFITISYWESIEAMSRFTGGDPMRIHHLDRDPEFLIELPSGVQILRLLASHGNTGGNGPPDRRCLEIDESHG